MQGPEICVIETKLQVTFYIIGIGIHQAWKMTNHNHVANDYKLLVYFFG